MESERCKHHTCSNMNYFHFDNIFRWVASFFLQFFSTTVRLWMWFSFDSLVVSLRRRTNKKLLLSRACWCTFCLPQCFWVVAMVFLSWETRAHVLIWILSRLTSRILNETIVDVLFALLFLNLYLILSNIQSSLEIFLVHADKNEPQ